MKISSLILAAIGTFAIYFSFHQSSRHVTQRVQNHHAHTLAPLIKQEVVTMLSQQFNIPITITSVTKITPPDQRNTVFRITISAEKNVPASVIFKQFAHDDDSQKDTIILFRLQRNWAGLIFVNSLPSPLPLAPRFYGGSMKWRFILQEDLRASGNTPRQAIISGDSTTAITILHRIAQALGQLHAQSYPSKDTYSRLLASLAPTTPTWQLSLQKNIDTLLPNIETVFTKFTLDFSASLHNEIILVIQSMLAPSPFTTFIHGDPQLGNIFTFPENDHIAFIDFEFSFLKNALLDIACIRMDTPDYWQHKIAPTGKLREKLIAELDLTYRAELMKTMPAAKDDLAYYTAYTHACAFLMLQGLARIPVLLESPKPQSFMQAKSRLADFITVAQKHNLLPHLQAMAKLILQKLPALKG